MSPCHNLEPSLVARDSSRLLSVKPNEWMHLSPFYTRMHGEWLRYAKSTSQFHWRFLLVRDVRGFQVNPLCRHDITSPFPPSGNGGYVRNLDVLCLVQLSKWWECEATYAQKLLSQWEKVAKCNFKSKAQVHEKCFFLMKWTVFCNAEDRFSWVWAFLQKKSF